MMQFQMFLQQLIPAMEFGTALMTPLAVLLAILYSCDGGNLRKTFRKAAYWGFWGSVFIMAAKQGTRNAVSREGFEGLMAFFAIISELILAGVLLGSSEKFMKRLGIFKKGVIINVLALTMYYGMEIWLIPVTTVLNVNNPFSAEMLIRRKRICYRIIYCCRGELAHLPCGKIAERQTAVYCISYTGGGAFNSADYLSCPDSDGKGNPSCTVPDQGDGTGY